MPGMRYLRANLYLDDMRVKERCYIHKNDVNDLFSKNLNELASSKESFLVRILPTALGIPTQDLLF